jgi:hypothetical protein
LELCCANEESLLHFDEDGHDSDEIYEDYKKDRHLDDEIYEDKSEWQNIELYLTGM